jgi:hypothetical protein
MKLYLLLFTTIFYIFSSFSIAEDLKIYHWVDENGKSHFSDTAVPGTKEIDVKNNNLLPASENNNDNDNENLPDLSEVTMVNYRATITSPQHDKALRSNDGTLDIYVAIEPEKQNTHKLQLYLDGKKLGAPQISSTIRALNIDRGTHQVQVSLLDESGQILAKTQIVTVHLQRAGK